jgi:hypothetical protein
MLPPDHPPTREHLRPRSRLCFDAGASNRKFACVRCNVEKADHTLVELLAVLIVRRDRRAEQVAAIIQGLCSRGLHDLCGDQGG